jgi:hypothetical protein
MEIEYKVPDKLKVKLGGEDKDLTTHLTGIIVVEVPGYEESAELAMMIAAQPGKDGEIKDLTSSDMAKKVLEACDKYVKKVDVKDAKGKYTFTKLRDLGCFREGRALINDIFETLVAGFKLGNE